MRVLAIDCATEACSVALLEAGASRLIGLDRDPEALSRSRDALAAFGARVELVHSDYRSLTDVLDARGIARVDGVLADLGVSSMQLDALVAAAQAAGALGAKLSGAGWGGVMLALVAPDTRARVAAAITGCDAPA